MDHSVSAACCDGKCILLNSRFERCKILKNTNLSYTYLMLGDPGMKPGGVSEYIDLLSIGRQKQYFAERIFAFQIAFFYLVNSFLDTSQPWKMLLDYVYSYFIKMPYDR